MTDPVIIGHHLTFVIGDASVEALESAAILERLARDAADAAGSQVVQLVVHRFEPHGLTLLAVLADSHIAIHSWPERGWLTLDMFTCLAKPTATKQLVEGALRVFDGRLCTLAQQPRIVDPGPLGQAPPMRPGRRRDSYGSHASPFDQEWALRLSLQLAEGDGSDAIERARHALQARRLDRRSSPISWCSACHGSRVQSDALAGWLAAATFSRPRRERSLGQNPVNHATNARRAAYMTMRGDANGMDVLIIGDDDLTSIALATVAHCTSLTVVDYDRRVLDYVAEMSDRYALGIVVRLLDAAPGLPDDLVESADCVFCDPIPSIQGMRMFFSLALQALRPCGVLYTSAVPTDAPNLAELHSAAREAGFLVTDMLHGFSEYPGDRGDRLAVKGALADAGVEFSETWVRLERVA